VFHLATGKHRIPPNDPIASFARHVLVAVLRGDFSGRAKAG
jgi:hypothetical protein